MRTVALFDILKFLYKSKIKKMLWYDSKLTDLHHVQTKVSGYLTSEDCQNALTWHYSSRQRQVSSLHITGQEYRVSKLIH